MASILKRRILKATLVTSGCLLILISLAALTKQTTQSWEHFRLSLVGLGPVKIGMRPDQVNKAFGKPLQFPKGSTWQAHSECYYLWPHGNRQEPVSFMVTQNRISRIDVLRPSLMTMSGAQVGMSEQRLKSMYHPLTMQPHKYNPKGHVFVYRSKMPIYQPYTLLFETDGQRVTSFRSGLDAEVSWVEGCS